MTGKQMYEMYKSMMDETGLPVSKWESLFKDEKDVWRTMAREISNGHKLLVSMAAA